MPRKAGNRSLRKFMIDRSMAATTPGFVTSSFRVGTLTFIPSFSAVLAALSVYLECRPCRSAAAASISGPIDSVILDGSCSISF